MKRLITLLLAALVLALAGCGGNAEAPAAEETSQAAETSAPTAEDNSLYADEMFAVEDVVYEMRRDEFANFEFKIRNITDGKFLRLSFRVQALDSQKDVLAAWSMGGQDPLEAGQAMWYYCDNNLFDDCRSLEELMERADSLRITHVRIQTVQDDPASWVQYDFSGLPTFPLADIAPKG